MSDQQAVRWEHRPGRDLALWQGDVEVARYNFATDRRKPFVHPLRTVDGVDLAAHEPADHRWHRGLWFAWKFLDGVNYWEERADDLGRTELVGDEQVALSATAAVVRSAYHYLPDGGAPVLEERRSVTLAPPDGAGRMRLDWDHAFTTCAEAVEIAPMPLAQADWGGYAGMSWRVARTLSEFRALNSEGLRDEATEHARARWLDLSGVADGGPDVAVAGVAIFDHPDNPRHPSAWRCILEPGFGFTNPSLVLHEPYRLAPGEELRLRYRVLVHRGWGAADELDAEFAAYARSRDGSAAA
jgi:hypothetical protein